MAYETEFVNIFTAAIDLDKGDTTAGCARQLLAGQLTKDYSGSGGLLRYLASALELLKRFIASDIEDARKAISRASVNKQLVNEVVAELVILQNKARKVDRQKFLAEMELDWLDCYSTSNEFPPARIG